jgi:hypothetical protein
MPTTAEHKDRRQIDLRPRCGGRRDDYLAARSACCGGTHIEFFRIDHANGGGSQHRKEGSSVYEWLVDNHFPGEFNELCANCNVGKHFNDGICSSIAHAGRAKTTSHCVMAETIIGEDL